jgi:amino acid permease
MLVKRLTQVVGVFAGVALTAWVFLYLLGVSMQHDGAERFTVIIPIIGLIVFLLAVKRHTEPSARWALLEFFAGSLITYLLLQFVIIRFI